MDNIEQLSSLLSPILSDPEALGSILETAEQLGLGGMLGGNSAPPPPPSQPRAEDLGGGISPDLLSTVGKLAPILASVGKEDDTSRLLLALKPFLSGKRERKLETAERMVSMMRVLSVLKDNKLM